MLEAARQSVRLHLGQDDPAALPVLRTVYRALRERPMAAQAAKQAGELRSRAKVLEQESLPTSGFFRWLFASRPQRERAAAAVEDIRALLESETARSLPGGNRSRLRPMPPGRARSSGSLKNRRQPTIQRWRTSPAPVCRTPLPMAP